MGELKERSTLPGTEHATNVWGAPADSTTIGTGVKPDRLTKITPILDGTTNTANHSIRRPSDTSALFKICGGLRLFALFAMGIMGLWPLLLQVIMEPHSVFGDGHGDRYEQKSYYAFENDHYQILRPYKVVCDDLKAALFSGQTPTATQDLIRAVPATVFQTVRELVVNQTVGSNAAQLSVTTGILGLSAGKSVCFGGVDDEGSVQVEMLLSSQDATSFGLDSVCLATGSTHLRLRLQSTEFYVTGTMGELNPSRISGAMLIVSPVDANLNPVISVCHEYTRKERYAATTNQTEYKRLVTVYSHQLLVPNDCSMFHDFGGSRDKFGCAYSSIGASGAVADLLSDGSQRKYSFPAPWRMIQCTVAGECSSLLFTQLWLSEWTVEDAASSTAPTKVLRHNFVNHKVIEVTVDGTISLRFVIILQILALVVTAYLTSARQWHKFHCRFISPWTRVMNATTSCTLAKIVRSSYNFILVAQMVLGVLQWRKQMTVDMLVGADTQQAVLRAAGCGTLIIFLAINIIFARAGDLKMQEIEPGFGHIVSIIVSAILYGVSNSHSVAVRTRKLLISGMTTVPADEVTQYSGCRGSSVCAHQASLKGYAILLTIIVIVSVIFGVAGQATLQVYANLGQKCKFDVGSKEKPQRNKAVNSFTRFLDDRSRSVDMFDCSTEVYIQSPNTTVLSTRSQLEACGFVPASTMLFRYRDLPLFLVARVLPVQVLNFFNLTVTVYELVDTDEQLGGIPIMHVTDQIIHAHWTTLKSARLDWSLAYYGGEGSNSLSRRASIDK